MTTTDYKLYTEVQLAKNLPELGFIKGDVATIIDTIITPITERAIAWSFLIIMVKHYR